MFKSNLNLQSKESEASYLAFCFGESVIPPATPANKSDACEEGAGKKPHSYHIEQHNPIESNFLVTGLMRTTC